MPLFRPPLTITKVVGSTTSGPTTTSTTAAVIPDMTITTNVQGLVQEIEFFAAANVVSGDAWDYAIYVDGVQQADTLRHVELQGTAGALGTNPSIPGHTIYTKAVVTGLSVGSHTFTAEWLVNGGGSARLRLLQRSITLKDVY